MKASIIFLVLVSILTQKNTPMGYESAVLQEYAADVLRHAHTTSITPEDAAEILPISKPAQCIMLAQWLQPEIPKVNQLTMLSVFLRTNKISTRKQVANIDYLRNQLETHGHFLHALGSLMSAQKYPDKLPLKALYQFVENGRQMVLRKKLYAHSELEPEQVDFLVFSLIQELAKYD